MRIETRDVVGFEGLYEVGSDGSVWAKEKTIMKRGREYRLQRKRLKAHLDKVGYRTFKLRKGGKYHHRKGSVMVCEAFNGPRPGSNPLKMHCSHLNGVSGDDRAENLAWESASANAMRKHEHGTMPCMRGEDNHLAKLTEEKVAEIRERVASGEKQKDVAKAFGVSPSTVNAVVHRRRWV